MCPGEHRDREPTAAPARPRRLATVCANWPRLYARPRRCGRVRPGRRRRPAGDDPPRPYRPRVGPCCRPCCRTSTLRHHHRRQTRRRLRHRAHRSASPSMPAAPLPAVASGTGATSPWLRRWPGLPHGRPRLTAFAWLTRWRLRSECANRRVCELPTSAKRRNRKNLPLRSGRPPAHRFANLAESKNAPALRLPSRRQGMSSRVHQVAPLDRPDATRAAADPGANPGPVPLPALPVRLSAEADDALRHAHGRNATLPRRAKMVRPFIDSRSASCRASSNPATVTLPLSSFSPDGTFRPSDPPAVPAASDRDRIGPARLRPVGAGR